MLSAKMQGLASGHDGELPSHTFPGAYPLFYIDSSMRALCPDCANKHEQLDNEVIEFDVNWENDSLYCDVCNELIVPAYGEEKK